MLPWLTASRAVALAALLALLLLSCTRRHGTEPTASSTAPAEAPAAAAVADLHSPHSVAKHAPAATDSASTRAAQLSAGKAMYQRHCQLCHGADAQGYAADNAPSLVSRTFLESASDDFIAHGIRVGRPNTPMAAYGSARGGPLNDAQIADLVAFIRSHGPVPVLLPRLPPSGDAQRGAALYEKSCRSCHGTATLRGNAPQLHNPEFLASATPEFLRYAIVHGRPPTPMPAFEQLLSQPEVEDLVAWIGSLVPKSPTVPAPLDPRIPEDLPVVINPRGARPKFQLREGRFVSAEQVQKALSKKNRIILIDARSTSDWLQFRIPGAIPLPYYDAERLERIPNDGTWVVAYCACPHHASGEIVDALRRHKYPNTAILDEGILVWRERGYALEGETVQPTPARK